MLPFSVCLTCISVSILKVFFLENKMARWSIIGGHFLMCAYFQSLVLPTVFSFADFDFLPTPSSTESKKLVLMRLPDDKQAPKKVLGAIFTSIINQLMPNLLRTIFSIKWSTNLINQNSKVKKKQEFF